MAIIEILSVIYVIYTPTVDAVFSWKILQDLYKLTIAKLHKINIEILK